MYGPPDALTVAISALHVLPPEHDSLAEQSSISPAAQPPSVVDPHVDPIALGISNGHAAAPSVPDKQHTLVPLPQSDALSHTNESVEQDAPLV